VIPTTTDLPGSYISTVPLFDPATVRAAALTATGHARDVDEARLFLAQLGLCGQQLRPGTGLLACGHPASEAVRLPGYNGARCRTCKQQNRTTDHQKDAA